MSTLEVTPTRRFEFQSLDNISICVSLHRVSLWKLGVLRERAEEHDARKIDDVASNLRGVNEDLLEMMDDMSRRWDQPSMPVRGFAETPELDREKYTEELRVSTTQPLRLCRTHLERAKGPLRNLRARARDKKQTEEVRNLDNDLERLDKIGKDLRGKMDTIMELDLSRARELDFARARELELSSKSSNPRDGGFTTFNGISKEKYYLVFNKDEIFKDLISAEGHFRNFTDLKEDKVGFLNCVVKHLASAESHADEAVSHALIAENEETSRRFLELRDKMRDLRRYIQSSPITRDEGIREIRKLRRQFEAFNVDYDVSKCETCGDPSEVMEEITKILGDLKKTPLKVAAHKPEADEFLLMEREMAEKLISKLSKKYGVESPKIEILDTCHEPSDATYSKGTIYTCRSGLNLHVLAHEFWHHVQSEKGMHLDEGVAEKFAVELFKAPPQKGLYANHTHSHNERKMVKSIKDVGIIYGLQQLGYAADYSLKYADTLRPAGFMGQPISFWGDIIGTVGGIAGALYLDAPYDLVAAMVGGYLSTDLWNQLTRLVPMRVAVPPMVYTPEPATPPAVTAKGRYVIT